MSPTNPYAVRLDDWRCAGSGYTDSTGVSWWLKPIEGWRASGGRDAEFAKRPRASGAYPDNTYAAARVITIEGRGHAPDLATRDAAMDTVVALAGDGLAHRLYVSEAHRTRWADCYLTDETTADPINPYVFDFSIQLTAPNPLRYGDTPGRARTQLRSSGLGGLNFTADSVTRQNLDTNAYLANDATGWSVQPSGSFSSAARASVTTFARAWAYRVVPSAAVTGTLLCGPPVAVSPGITHWFSVGYRATSALTVTPSVQWLDASGAVLDTAIGTSVAVAANTNIAVEFPATAPAGTATAQKILTVANIPASAQVWVTQAMTVPNLSYSVAYFDGGSAGGSWDGAAGTSASRQTVGVSGMGFPLDFGTAGRAGQMQARNEGTAPTAPVLRVYGPVAPHTLLNPDNTGALRYGDSLAGGDYVDYDCDAKTVLLNGITDRYTSLSQKDFEAFTLHPGANLKVVFQAGTDENPNAAAELLWYPAWR